MKHAAYFSFADLASLFMETAYNLCYYNRNSISFTFSSISLSFLFFSLTIWLNPNARYRVTSVELIN